MRRRRAGAPPVHARRRRRPAPAAPAAAGAAAGAGAGAAAAAVRVARGAVRRRRRRAARWRAARGRAPALRRVARRAGAVLQRVPGPGGVGRVSHRDEAAGGAAPGRGGRAVGRGQAGRAAGALAPDSGRAGQRHVLHPLRVRGGVAEPARHPDAAPAGAEGARDCDALRDVPARSERARVQCDCQPAAERLSGLAVLRVQAEKRAREPAGGGGAGAQRRHDWPKVRAAVAAAVEATRVSGHDWQRQRRVALAGASFGGRAGQPAGVCEGD
ncbi:hypothetical protein FGB62_28g27 [Gracilaria domingensis]|nr:hypothetical protein FGB62_28g27 [Gracilaria domingensis]